MSIRGFDGEYNVGSVKNIAPKDLVYLVLWAGFFVLALIYNIPMQIGNLITGVIF